MTGYGVRGLASPHPFLGCHGRYGPEGPLQWLVSDWYCWLLCTSCCVPSLVGRPRMLGMLAGTDLKYICSGMYKLVFWCFYTSRCSARGVQENWIFGDGVVFFYGPLYLEVTCSSCLPEEYRVAYFREMTPGMFPYSLFLVQQRIHVWHQSSRLFGRISRFPT